MKKNFVYIGFIFVLFLNLPLISTAQTANQFKITVIHYDYISPGSEKWDFRELDSDRQGQFLSVHYSAFEIPDSVLKVYQMPDGGEHTIEPLWTMEFDGRDVYPRLSDDGSRLFVADLSDSMLYCFRPNSSTSIWSTDTYEYPYLDSLAISPDNAYLLLIHSDSIVFYLSLLDASNGNQIWNLTSPIISSERFISASFSDSNVIYCSYGNGTVRSFDLEKTLLWETHNTGNELIMQRSGDLMIAKNQSVGYYILNASDGDILKSKEFPGYSIWDIAMGDSGLDYIVNIYSPSESKLMFMTRDSAEHRNEISDLSAIYNLCPITLDMSYLVAVTDKELIFIDSMNAEIVATRSYSDELQVFEFSRPNEKNQVGIFSDRGQFLILNFEIIIEAEDPGLTELSILDQIVEAFVNRNNWIALGLASFVGLLVGALIFRRKK